MDTGVFRRVVERYGEFFSPFPDAAPPGQHTRWTVTDARSLRDALQAMPVRDLQAVHDGQDAADRLRRAESRLTGAGRLLETLDLLDDDTRRRTRSLVIALLRESAELTLKFADAIEANQPSGLHEGARAPATVIPTLTLDLRESTVPAPGRALRAALADGAPLTAGATQVPTSRTVLDMPGDDTSPAAPSKLVRGRGRALVRLLTRARNRTSLPARHARRAH